jgi:hypothetical protein
MPSGGKSSPLDARQTSHYARRPSCVRLLGMSDPELILVAEVHEMKTRIADI